MRPITTTTMNMHRGGALAALNRGSPSGLAQAMAVQEIYSGFIKMGLQMLKLHDNKAQLPFGAPRTRMNRSISHASREVAICSVPLDRARAIGSATGGKLNDVVLALVDAALQDYLAAARRRVRGAAGRVVSHFHPRERRRLGQLPRWPLCWCDWGSPAPKWSSAWRR